MKRINFSIVTLLVVAMTLLFASCTKDGVYKPKKKIAKIYETVLTDPNNNDKMLKEEWKWDGKLLSSITYHYGTIVETTEVATFTYDKNQLTTITLGDTRMELTYDGKLIETMKSYSDNELEATYTFEHGDKNRITGYKVEYNNTAKSNVAKNACLIESAFRFLIPEIATSEAKEYVKTATDQRKDNRNYSVTMTYDGKNVASKTITYSNGSTECTYAYTEYKNPFYGLLSDENNNATSKNAVSQMVVKNPLLPVYANSPDYTYTYTYKTDGKVPTQVIEQLEWTLTVGTTTTSHNEKIQTDYEFVD